jgi:hypothetical protein
VQFGTRGAFAPALGLGEIILRDRVESVVLSEALHVPELTFPILSLKVAVVRGLAVLFSLLYCLRGSNGVVVMHRGQVVLTEPQGVL